MNREPLEYHEQDCLMKATAYRLDDEPRKRAVFTSPGKISASREGADAAISDEEIVVAITEEESVADGPLAGGRKLTEEVNTARKRPAVIVCPAWRGPDSFAHQQAEALTQQGFLAIVADIYGEGLCVDNNEEAAKLMRPLFLNRPLLQRRLKALFEKVTHHPFCDVSRIAIIGFCFGGLCAIEALRSGLPLRGAVSFHGVLGCRLDGEEAALTPIADGIKGSLLLLHGHDDPLVPPSDVAALEQEMTEAKVDWQIHIYGGAMHAFTNPKACDPDFGTVYQEKADKRSHKAAENFFQEIFR